MAEANRAAGSFPIARLCALLAVVAMTALNFVSCAGVEIRGHELLRNRVPDVAGLDPVTKAVGAQGAATSGHGRISVKAGDHLFEGRDAWLHWVYVAAFAFAVVALLVPSNSRVVAMLGIAGLVAIGAFVLGFDAMLTREKVGVTVRLEVGAYATLAAFAGMLVLGIRGRGRI